MMKQIGLTLAILLCASGAWGWQLHGGGGANYVLNDPLTEASSTAFTAHTPTAGGSWVFLNYGYNVWTVGPTGLTTTNDAITWYANSAAHQNQNHYSKLTITLSESSELNWTGVFIRGTNTGRGGYLARLAGNGNFRLQEYQGGSWVADHINTMLTLNLSNTYAIRLQSIANVFTCEVIDVTNSNNVIYTNSSITDDTQQGLYVGIASQGINHIKTSIVSGNL